MKQTKIIILITVVTGIVAFWACSKNFLNQQNTFGASEDATFQKESDVVGLINGIYDSYQNADLLKKSIWYYANFQTHDWFNYGADVAWNNYQITPNFAALSVFWNNAYIAIARANSAFGIIDRANAKGIVSAALAQRLKGEAYFLRGMTYYYLAGSFGGVPLELNSVTDGLTPRSSQDSVFAQVVVDMDSAAGLLPWKEDYAASDLGRATKGAAIGYKGQAQMWLKDYAGAITTFNQLDGKYHLLPKFLDVHEFNNQNNDESLFEIQFDLPQGGSQSWDGSWQNGGELAWIDDFGWPEEISNFGYDYGNPALWLSYQSGDTRKFATIIGPGDSSISPGIIGRGGIKSYPLVISGFTSTDTVNYGGGVSIPRKLIYTGDDNKIINTCGSLARPWYGLSDQKRSGYYDAKKWRDPTLNGNSGDQTIFGSQNQIMLRYAEILLSRAECKVHTGDVAGAMADIKLVRDRAWGGTAPAIMQDGARYDGTPAAPITDPLQMVLSEYRHELTAEYSLFYDLRRAGTDVAIAFIHDAYGTDNTTDPQPNPAPGPTHDGQAHGIYRTALTAGRDLLPIPQAARGLNPNLTQNPAYQ
ncbi:MAG: RagB/SusD family nutrient uptake outer membrane protein [Chitinophagaceae bacterium]|jgi:hypothetical protein|nr:RagB/SusD family nutrient uptake outer membrane protein [Chitinophagaceae bacterium]